ncbi:hypothetical protein [Kutzneria sp. NPDC052558]|uniref:hypothetical protein n=1 Tax=Kutzneria sp. NPDC052558 TaxID=3364121 RepID=UPI0037C5B0D0
MTSEIDVHEGRSVFERNRQLLAEIERELAERGGVGDDAPRRSRCAEGRPASTPTSPATKRQPM